MLGTQVSNARAFINVVAVPFLSFTVNHCHPESLAFVIVMFKSFFFTQGTLRPIFESRLKQKRSVRERAMVLRKKVAEAGVNYNELSGIYKEKKEHAKEVR